MKQLQGKTEYAQAKDLLRLMEQNAVTAHELVELIPMRESFIINFYNITKREMENDAFCHRQSLKGIVKMVLILRDAAYDANVSPNERIRIIEKILCLLKCVYFRSSYSDFDALLNSTKG